MNAFLHALKKLSNFRWKGRTVRLPISVFPKTLMPFRVYIRDEEIEKVNRY